jgi:hypothetical protein
MSNEEKAAYSACEMEVSVAELQVHVAQARESIPRIAAAINLVYGDGTAELVFENGVLYGMRLNKIFKETPETRLQIEAILRDAESN